jgi:short-subunit dehydrogenase
MDLPMDPFSLPSAVIVLTGASSGIGEALAVRAAEAGARVVLGARRADRLAAVAERIRTVGGTASAYPCDVTDSRQAVGLVAHALSTFGGLDVLVNNAGRGHFSSVEDTTDAMLASMFAVNTFALWYTTRPALRHMKARRAGHIINVASIAGKIGFPYNSAYVAAKYACVGFTHALRLELMDTGVHASVVCPGGVATDWATATEGGPIRAMFSAAGPHIKRIAAERELPLPDIEGVLPPEAIADRILDCMRHPVAEVYTHRGEREFVELAARDREEAEGFQRAVVLGERAVYDTLVQGAPPGPHRTS